LHESVWVYGVFYQYFRFISILGENKHYLYVIQRSVKSEPNNEYLFEGNLRKAEGINLDKFQVTTHNLIISCLMKGVM